MVGVLMRDQYVLNGRGVNVKPAHLFPQPVIVISGIDHNRCAVFRVKENVGDPFSHAGNMFIDPPGIQGLEDFFAPITPTHYFLLKNGILL